MKIYNKKRFATGTGMLFLAMLNLATHLFKQTEADVWFYLLMAFLVLDGLGEIRRSLSREAFRADRLEELDERNQLLALKAKGRAYQLGQRASFVLIVLMLIGGGFTGETALIGIAVGLTFTWSISLFCELGAEVYYDSKL